MLLLLYFGAIKRTNLSEYKTQNERVNEEQKRLGTKDEFLEHMATKYYTWSFLYSKGKMFLVRVKCEELRQLKRR
jgi:DNA gyrase subunit A